MSHQNNEESPRLLAETTETCESDSLSSLELSDSENSTAEYTHRSTPLSCFNGPEGDDDTVLTSEAVDINKRDIPVKLPGPRIEADKISLDLSELTCGQSDSEERGSSTQGSEHFSWLEPEGFERYYEEYIYQLKKLRSNGYFFPFELIWLALTIASCCMGAHYWSMCPADEYIPRYVFFNGVIGTFSVCVEIMGSLWKFLLRQPAGVRRYFCAFGVFWIATITTLIEMIQFYTMSYSFHTNDEKYCNETFYLFVFYKNIAFGVLFFLTAMIYIPSFDYHYYLRE